jgi:hypothetical protein
MGSVYGEQKYPSVRPYPEHGLCMRKELVALARFVRADGNSKPTITAFSNTMRTTELLNSTNIEVES